MRSEPTNIRIWVELVNHNPELTCYNFVPRDVIVEGDDAVEEGEKADDGGGDEEVGVEAEPGEVERDLDAKVVANCIQRLQIKTRIQDLCHMHFKFPF